MHTIPREVSTGAIETRISNQTRNRKQSSRNEEKVKNHRSFFIKTFKKHSKILKLSKIFELQLQQITQKTTQKIFRKKS